MRINKNGWDIFGRRCPDCGEAIRKYTRACPKCGTSVKFSKFKLVPLKN